MKPQQHKTTAQIDDDLNAHHEHLCIANMIDVACILGILLMLGMVFHP